MGKLNLVTKACGVFLAWAVAGVALPAQTFTTLHSFDGADGANPEAGLVQSTNGNLYGTTVGGGSSACGTDGCGTVFDITPSGEPTTLYRFSCSRISCPDGINPYAGLVQATNGNFYGTTYFGGTKNQNCNLGQYNGCGAIFKITPRGKLTTLYNFCPQGGGCPGGAQPAAGLVQGADGNLYGTAATGGNTGCFGGGCGTVFQLSLSGTLTTLHIFDFTDGEGPYAGLVQGTDGDFYGTTAFGGAYDNCYTNGPQGCGTIFQITPSGTLTTLHNFAGTDGYGPYGELLQDTDGNFYGTTLDGGDGSNCGNNGCGTVFSLSVGLGPFVKANPAAGKAGAAIGILGTDLTGATGVKFNGTETAFRVVSSTFIEAKVPSGATSGQVTVQLPGGTLSSNVPFIVLP
jgi:uncharacterized repeat protein (TIGR03803 family)